MGTITAQSIIDLAGQQLLDAGHVRWTAGELLADLNNGQRAIVNKKSDALSITEAIQLAAGTTQAVPAGRERLIELHRNMGTDGLTPGRAVTVADKAIMDRTYPNWHTSTPAAEVAQWFYDPRSPEVFWVFPPQPAVSPGYVEGSFVAIPSDVALGDPITISDTYSNALLHYVLFMAFNKDAKHQSMLVRASNNWEVFRVAIGEKEQAERRAETVVTNAKVHEGVKG